MNVSRHMYDIYIYTFLFTHAYEPTRIYMEDLGLITFDHSGFASCVSRSGYPSCYHAGLLRALTPRGSTDFLQPPVWFMKLYLHGTRKILWNKME